MRGYCPRCKEYRSDNGFDAWRIIWKNGRPTCERCGSYVDVWMDEAKNRGKRLAKSSMRWVLKEEISRRKSEKRKTKNKEKIQKKIKSKHKNQRVIPLFP